MSYIGSKRSSSLVSFDEGTIGSGVVFPAGMVLQIASFSTEAEITVAYTIPNGTGRILNDGINNVSVQLITKKANPNYTVIYGSGMVMEIDYLGDFYGSAGIGFICNQNITVDGNALSANTIGPAISINQWNDEGTLTAINYSAYRGLDTADRIIPMNFLTEVKNVTTSLSSGTSITFSVFGGFYNNTQVMCVNPYITVIEY